MFSPRHWNDLAKASFQMTAMSMEASAVIWMRMMGMAGGWNVSPGENGRMVAEKISALIEAQQLATRALGRGKTPLEAATVALKPVRRRTSANLSRLSKSGPKF